MQRYDRAISEMVRYYDRRAKWHDRYMDYHSPEQIESRYRPILEAIEPLVASKRLLEIACGTGNWTQLLARIASHVTAIDSSDQSLEIARAKLAGFDNVTITHGDAYRLSAEIGHFDVTFAADFYSHIPNVCIPAFLGSLRHVAPGGTVIFTDMLLSDYFVNEESYRDADGNRVSRRTLPDGSQFLVIKNFPSEAELRDQITPFARDCAYAAFPGLQRWMLTWRM